MTTSTRLHTHGFSLVEVLVGMAIGLLGLLAVFKTVSVWDSHTRSTTSGSDAQVAGTLAMYSLERDIRQAGMGFGTAPLADMGCTVDASDTQRAGVTFQFSMFPVQIVPGVDNAPDAVQVMYGNSSFFTSTQTFSASTDSTKKLVSRSGFKRGDLAVVSAGYAGAPGGSSKCALIQVTDDSDPDGLTIVHGNGSYSAFATGAASGVARFNSVPAPAPAFAQGRVFNLGPEPRLNRWEIVSQRLLARTDLIHATTASHVAEGVINLKAQYGVDADGNLRITDGRTSGEPNEWTLTPPVDWTKVLAVRVSILVRSQQFERRASTAPGASAVTTLAPVWVGGAFVMANVDGSPDSFDATSPDPNNWRNYRYRVYDKIIPLRNMIWGTSTGLPAPPP